MLVEFSSSEIWRCKEGIVRLPKDSNRIRQMDEKEKEEERDGVCEGMTMCLPIRSTEEYSMQIENVMVFKLLQQWDDRKGFAFVDGRFAMTMTHKQTVDAEGLAFQG